MTLVEALKKGDLVRRKAWPWWQCLNNISHNPTRVWAILERPAYNGWQETLSWVDAVAEDWESIKKTP
jgi:hypothetical protein